MFINELQFKIWRTEEALTKCAVPENNDPHPRRVWNFLGGGRSSLKNALCGGGMHIFWNKNVH